MCNRIPDRPDGILDVAGGRMKAAQAKWSRLTADDLSAVRDKQDLIMRVEERYGLPHWLAAQDVELWAAALARRRQAADSGALPRRIAGTPAPAPRCPTRPRWATCLPYGGALTPGCTHEIAALTVSSVGRRQPQRVLRGPNRAFVFPERILPMAFRAFAAAAALSLLAFPLAAQAQSGGAAAGATTGAVGGAIVGGPVGAVAGAVGGAIVGGLADEQRPRFRQYVVQQRPASYRYQQEVQVGAVLPSSGVTYYEVPAEYGVRDYRYTVVNDRTVLVDPRTHRVIQIVE